MGHSRIFRKYADFSGRASRAEYRTFTLANISIMVGLMVMNVTVGDSAPVVRSLGAAYGLALIVPRVAFSVRRLHDVGRSGWWLLFGLVPVLGLAVLCLLLKKEGEPGPNQYGPAARAAALPTGMLPTAVA